MDFALVRQLQRQRSPRLFTPNARRPVAVTFREAMIRVLILQRYVHTKPCAWIGTTLMRSNDLSAVTRSIATSLDSSVRHTVEATLDGWAPLKVDCVMAMRKWKLHLLLRLLDMSRLSRCLCLRRPATPFPRMSRRPRTSRLWTPYPL